MERSEQIRFDKLYQKHLTTLKLQGKSQSTIDLYSRPLRRVAAFFDRCPDTLKPDDLKTYFAALVGSLRGPPPSHPEGLAALLGYPPEPNVSFP